MQDRAPDIRRRPGAPGCSHLAGVARARKCPATSWSPWAQNTRVAEAVCGAVGCRCPREATRNAYVLPTHAWRFVDVWPRTATMLRDVGETLNAWRATVTPMPSAARRVRRLGAWASARGGAFRREIEGCALTIRPRAATATRRVAMPQSGTAEWQASQARGPSREACLDRLELRPSARLSSRRAQPHVEQRREDS